jgi:cytochrome c biogenesis protein CcmG/thiol:disulfide interchange protein DsbE
MAGDANGSNRGSRAGRAPLRSLVLLFACSCAASFAPAAGPPSLVNRKAPAFTRRAFDGRDLSLNAFRGKVVLLNFWATWCAPCQAEMPTFARWQRQYGTQGLQVIGISMDDSAAQARKLAQKLRIDYPIVLGDAALGEKYGGVLGLPVTYLIDRTGTIRAEFQGGSDLGKMEAQLKELLRHP